MTTESQSSGKMVSLLVTVFIFGLVSVTPVISETTTSFADQKNFFLFPPAVGFPPIGGLTPPAGFPPVGLTPPAGFPPVGLTPPVDVSPPSDPVVVSPPSGSSPGSGSHVTPPYGTPSHGPGSGSSSGSRPPHVGNCSPGTPSSGHGSGGHHRSPPSHGSGSGGGHRPSTPSTPSGGGGGSYHTPPSSGSGSGGGHRPTTPSTPSGGGGGSYPPYQSPPTGGGGGVISPPTPSTPITIPGTPSVPGISVPSPPFVFDPNTPFTGTCNFWRTHTQYVWNLVGLWGTLGGTFGVNSYPGAAPTLTIPQALSNTRTDGYGALYREGTASLLNSMVNHRFPYTPSRVRSSFVTALSSNKAATTQAHLFKLANEGRVKLRA